MTEFFKITKPYIRDLVVIKHNAEDFFGEHIGPADYECVDIYKEKFDIVSINSISDEKHIKENVTPSTWIWIYNGRDTDFYLVNGKYKNLALEFKLRFG